MPLVVSDYPANIPTEESHCSRVRGRLSETDQCTQAVDRLGGLAGCDAPGENAPQQLQARQPQRGAEIRDEDLRRDQEDTVCR